MTDRLFSNTFREIPSPPGRVRFRYPNKPASIVLFLFGIFWLALLYGVFPVGRRDWLVAQFEKTFYLLVAGPFALFGVLILGVSLRLAWEVRLLEIDLRSGVLRQIRRTPFSWRSQRCPLRRMTKVTVTVKPGTEREDPGEYRVEITTQDGTPIALGGGGEEKSMAFARRISELTGVPLEIVDLRETD